MAEILKHASKSPSIRRLVQNIAPYKEGCATCGSKTGDTSDFRDALSKKEYSISGMCQECQDSVFSIGEE